MPAPTKTVYSLTLEAQPWPETPPVIRLRLALKSMLRQHGLKCKRVVQLDGEPDQDGNAPGNADAGEVAALAADLAEAMPSLAMPADIAQDAAYHLGKALAHLQSVASLADTTHG